MHVGISINRYEHSDSFVGFKFNSLIPLEFSAFHILWPKGIIRHWEIGRFLSLAIAYIDSDRIFRLLFTN